MNNNTHNLNKIYVNLMSVLPKATLHALQSYHEFASQDLTHNAKSFSAHHAACKAALTHIEYLIKLAQWLFKQTLDQPNSDKSLLNLIKEARLQLLKAQQTDE